MNLSQLCPCSYTSVTCTSHCTTHHWPYCSLQDTCMSNHTHLGTSSGVQLVLVDGQLHNFSMTVLSCHMQHGETMVLSTVVQRLHLGSHVLNRADMATRCSPVESIPSFLQAGKCRVSIWGWRKYERYWMHNYRYRVLLEYSMDTGTRITCRVRRIKAYDWVTVHSRCNNLKSVYIRLMDKVLLSKDSLRRTHFVLSIHRTALL